MTHATLNVPGASLSSEVRGSGPVLLMIPGGVADRAVFGSLPELLAGRYTVVTYDPRGISRSRLEGPVEAEGFIHVYADDARRLLAAVAGSEPAHVLGSSGGATIGLELVARWPELVRTFVAHEPPVSELLPDRERSRTQNDDVYDTYRREGVGPHRRCRSSWSPWASNRRWPAAGARRRASRGPRRRPPAPAYWPTRTTSSPTT